MPIPFWHSLAVYPVKRQMVRLMSFSAVRWVLELRKGRACLFWRQLTPKRPFVSGVSQKALLDLAARIQQSDERGMIVLRYRARTGGSSRPFRYLSV